MREETRDGSADGGSASSPADTRRRGRRSRAHRGSPSEGATEDRGTDRVSSIVSVSRLRVVVSFHPSRVRARRDKGGKTRKMARREVIVRLLNDPNESVVIDLDDVPKDAEDCAAVLQAELAPLSAWIETAEAYARAGDARGFETLMEMVCAPGTFRLDDVRFATRDERERVCVCVCVRWSRRRSVTTAVGFGD